jgi:small-conductance mechanosensitive channel
MAGLLGRMIEALNSILSGPPNIVFDFAVGIAGAVFISALFLFAIRVFSRRLIQQIPHPKWMRRFVIPIGVFAFLIIVRNRPHSHELLVANELEPWSKVASILALYWFLLSFSRFVGVYWGRRFDLSLEDNLDSRMHHTRLQFIEKLFVIVLTVVAGGSVLMCFESARQFGTSLLASAGVLGLVIGFASQKMVANLLAGFQIAFSQPIRLDDAVVIDGEWGRIEEITLTYVVVRLWDWRRLIVPLSRLLDQPFQNWTRTESKLIGTVFLKTSHLVNVDGVRKELEAILARTHLWDGRVSSVQVTDSSDTTMELRVLVSARNSSQAFDLRCFVREELIKYIVALNPSYIGEVRLKAPSPATN